VKRCFAGKEEERGRRERTSSIQCEKSWNRRGTGAEACRGIVPGIKNSQEVEKERLMSVLGNKAASEVQDLFLKTKGARIKE
jgi:hypothetical protein